MQLVGNLHSVTGYWSQFGTKWRLKSWCFQWSAASYDQTHLSVRARTDDHCACELFVNVPVAFFFASRRSIIVVVYTPFLRPCWRNKPFTSFQRLVYPSSYLFLAWCYFVIKSQNVCDNGCKERRRCSCPNCAPQQWVWRCGSSSAHTNTREAVSIKCVKVSMFSAGSLAHNVSLESTLKIISDSSMISRSKFS